MRKSFIVLLSLLFASHYMHAQDISQVVNTPWPNPPQRLTLSLSSAYQSENFRWSIAGNIQGTSPNIYSELRWKNLAGPAFGAGVDWNFWGPVHLHSIFSYMSITSGSVTDMDYQGDNRTNRSYDGAFDAGKGMSFSWRTMLESPILERDKLTIFFCLGFALHKQSLYLLGTDLTAPSSGLHSTYDTRYTGMVMGPRAKYRLSSRLSLEASLLWDWVAYRSRADWNLIATFQHPLSFEDIATGYNLEGGLKLNYSLQKGWTLFLSADYLHGWTGHGTDWLYLQNGQKAPTQFNEAVRDYIRAVLGARLRLF